LRGSGPFIAFVCYGRGEKSPGEGVCGPGVSSRLRISLLKRLLVGVKAGNLTAGKVGFEKRHLM
jgi:hypothetical protein